MSFFEREFQRLFGDETILKCLSFAGKTCRGWLNDDLRVTVQFTCANKGSYPYDALEITITDIMDRPVGAALLKFQDVWGIQYVPEIPHFPDGIVPHVWTCRGKTEWHGWRPAPADRELLRQQIRRHLEPFRERTPERSHDGPRLVYICAPLQEDAENNIEFARQKAREVFQSGDIPVCPHIILPSNAGPASPVRDQAAKRMGLRLLTSCQRVNVYGPAVTEEMQAEISRARERNIPVIYDPELLWRIHPRRGAVRKGGRER